MKKISYFLILVTLVAQPIMSDDSFESKTHQQEIYELKQAVQKISKQLKELKDEMKANHKEILMYAKQPREQHTHYGFLSPAPATVALSLGIPAVAALAITLILKK
jgi:septal ring factor EnvC (AmiA/AmiB activator)